MKRVITDEGQRPDYLAGVPRWSDWHCISEAVAQAGQSRLIVPATSFSVSGGISEVPSLGAVPNVIMATIGAMDKLMANAEKVHLTGFSQ
jgi:hypothetical protein